MLEAFNPEVHTQLNVLGCAADSIKELVYWSYGANCLTFFRYEQLVVEVKRMRAALLVLEALEKKFNDTRDF